MKIMKTEQEIKDRIEILKKDKETFSNFLRDTYGDKQCANKIEIHTWRISREIQILEWVLNKELPF